MIPIDSNDICPKILSPLDKNHETMVRKVRKNRPIARLQIIVSGVSFTAAPARMEGAAIVFGSCVLDIDENLAAFGRSPDRYLMKE